jgi:hypothetical protein
MVRSLTLKSIAGKSQSLSKCTTCGGLLEKSMGKKKKILFSNKLDHGLSECVLISSKKGFMRRHRRVSGEDRYENVQFKSWRCSVRVEPTL